MKEFDYKFNIFDICYYRGMERLKPFNNSEQRNYVCPVCGDRRGKFGVNGRKNTMHCFRASCGCEGGMLDLWMLTSEKSYSGPDKYKEAYADVMAEIFGDEASTTKKFVPTTFVEDTTPRADESIIDMTYRAMLDKLTLKESHKKDLLKRGLSEEDIVRFNFKSTVKDGKSLCRKLIKDGCKLKGVPGFYKNKNGEWTIYFPEGYLCPVYNTLEDRICGFQVRADKPKDGMKYLWVSSKGKEDGVTSKSPATFLLGDDWSEVLITEGILKATVIHVLTGKTVIGVPGVTTLKSAKPYLEHMKFKKMYEAYDMDKMPVMDEPQSESSKEIAKAAKKLRKMARNSGAKTESLLWDIDEKRRWRGEYKGYDDWLIREVKN